MATTGHVVAAQLGAPRAVHPDPAGPVYYGAVMVATVISVLASAVGVSPIRVLFVASIIGGLATPIGLAALMAVGSDTRLMGADAVRGGFRVAGWFVTGFITVLSIIYLIQQITGS